ncbi:MAG: PLP-dependent aminotransferase family protein [Acidobacteriaceae bacterium]
MKRVAGTFVLPIVINRRDKPPIHRQICEWFQCAIAEGRLRSGGCVPSSRGLAAELGVSRGSVVVAYEQLHAEGYFETFAGSGTHVAKSIPGQLPTFNATRNYRSPTTHLGEGVPGRISDQDSQRNNPSTQSRFKASGAFGVSFPALDHFPVNVWANLIARHSRTVSVSMLAYGDPMGYCPLREAIAEYVRMVRGVRCDASQVLITAGSQQAIQIASQVLLNYGDQACVEDPGYPGARQAFARANAQVVPISVDAEGIDVSELKSQGQRAKVVYVTPSHQYPMGITMSSARRMQLLNWACHNGTWIIEDDCGSEYRFDRGPIRSIQGLDTNARVIYVGTFSQAMYPALRLGYLVLPRDLIRACAAMKCCMDVFSPTLNQSAMAEFIREGHLAQHLRRMRMIYITRRNAIVKELQNVLRDSVEIVAGEAGLHLVILLHDGVDDAAVVEEAARSGISVAPLSSCRVRDEGRGGLLLGYGGVDVQGIQNNVRKLSLCIERVGDSVARSLVNENKTRDSTMCI